MMKGQENDQQKGAQRIAIYHCSIKIFSSGKGESAVGAAAYRSGEMRTNEIADYVPPLSLEE